MAILRVLTSAMISMGTFRSYQFVLLLAAALAVVAFYYIGSERHNFSSNTKRIRQSQASLNANRDDADVSLDTGPAGGGDSGPLAVEYHTLMMFTKVDKSKTLQEKFRVTMKSMAKHGRFLEGEMLVLHFVSDEASREIGEKMVPELFIDATFQYQVVFHGVGSLTEKLFPIVEVMQKHFSAGSGAYFSDAIFFLSVAMHRVMPPELKRIVQLDLDLQFRCNIRDLFQEFSRFPAGAVIGIGPELQPVYRHMFWQHRRENPKTRVGDPPPDGRPGFNSGVMLLDLEAMQGSVLYNQLLQPGRVTELAQQYKLQGHLGDQDFFTLVGMEYPGLFSPLACTWNRQLCTWWREHGYGEVFELYHRCEGPVHIYHGNCNTPIPDD